MRLTDIVAMIVMVQGVFFVRHADGDSSPSRSLESLLEEALMHTRQMGVSPGAADLIEATQNLTTAMQELTSALLNNTNLVASALGDREPISGQWLERAKCEPPFFPVGSECFYVNRYNHVTWAEAQQFCKGLGGDLAVPNDVNTLRAMLLEKFPEEDCKSFWIGLKESGGKEGSWAWISPKPFQATDWAAGQPDGGNENCVVLSRDDYPSLHDSPCYLNTMFICEKIVRLQ